MYKISELPIVNNEFRQVFGISIKPFIDNFLTAALTEITFDIIEFDKWLIKQHGDYDGISMEDVIKKYYGDKGVKIINKLVEI